MKLLNIYTIKIKGEDWQVVAIAGNARRAKLIGYKAIQELDRQYKTRYIDIRVKKQDIKKGKQCEKEKVMTSCEYNPFFCELWRYDIEMCDGCRYELEKMSNGKVYL